MPPGHVERFFGSLSKHVISFAGFGELGYQESGVVERIAGEVLAGHRPEDIVVNTGTLLRNQGESGVASVYPVARRRGIVTCGIHPGVALDVSDTHRVSPFEDHTFFVEDSTWGGYLPDGSLSPTLEVLLAVSGELVVIGGGKHAADELAAFIERGKPVRYFPAEMNHRTTRRWCESVGLASPDFRGEAYHVWRGRAD